MKFIPIKSIRSYLALSISSYLPAQTTQFLNYGSNFSHLARTEFVSIAKLSEISAFLVLSLIRHLPLSLRKVAISTLIF